MDMAVVLRTSFVSVCVPDSFWSGARSCSFLFLTASFSRFETNEFSINKSKYVVLDKRGVRPEQMCHGAYILLQGLLENIKSNKHEVRPHKIAKDEKIEFVRKSRNRSNT